MSKKNSRNVKGTSTAKKVSNALKNFIFDGIILIALGLVMLIWPEYSLKIIFTIAGIALIVAGVIKGIIFFTKKDKEERSVPDLLVGLLQIAVGIFAIVKADFLATIFPVVAGILLLYGAIVMIIRALKLRKDNAKVFPLCFVLGLVILVFAVVVLVQPVFLVGLMPQAAGAAMIAEGIALLIVMAQKEINSKS